MKHAAVRRIVLSKRQDGEAVFEVLDGPKAVEYDSASGKGLQVQLVSPAKLRDHLDVDGFHFVPGRSHTHTHTHAPPNHSLRLTHCLHCSSPQVPESCSQ